MSDVEQAPASAMVTSDVAVLEARLGEASRDNQELREELGRERNKTNTLRTELEQARIRSDKLERQMAGHDDDAHDPQKQRGVGGIPVGGPPGEFMREVEDMEERLGMSPTLDQQLRQLGLGEAGGVEPRQLVAGTSRDAHLVGPLIQLLWWARSVLVLIRHGTVNERDEHACRLVVAQINELPVSTVERYLDLAEWDGEGLPPLKE